MPLTQNLARHIQVLRMVSMDILRIIRLDVIVPGVGNKASTVLKRLRILGMSALKRLR